MNSNPIKPTNNSHQLIQEAKSIVNSIPQWNKGKVFTHVFNGNKLEIQTSSKEINNEVWFARSNVLTEELTKKYKDKFFKYLIGIVDVEENHTSHEKEYIHEFTKFEVKPFDDNSYLIKAHYELPLFMKPRLFFEWVHILNESETEAYVISLSLDPTDLFVTDSSHVIGRYTSIEHIQIIENKLHWSMCTASTPAGAIPNWLSRLSIPKAISKDVPSFLKYINHK